MDENRNKIDLKKEEKDDITEKKITEYYKDKEIAQFFKTILDNKINRILEELNNYYELGDWRNCVIILKKITINKLFPLFIKEKKIKLLDIIINKLIPNIYFYSMSDIILIIEFLTSNHRSIPKDYQFDWKKLYAVFLSIDLIEMNDTKNNIIYFFKLHKIISKKDIITFEDYTILRKTVLDDIISLNIKTQMLAMLNFMIFLPKKFIDNDDELQLRIFNMFKNWKNKYIPCCWLFSKILKNNGKLFFSKNPKENEEYIKQFIQFYFTYLNLYIIGDNKVKNKNNIIPIDYEDKNNNDFDINVVEILYYLLFNENLKEYSSYIDSHFNIILNNKHLYLKEKSRDVTAKNYIFFLQIFIYKIENSFTKRIYNKTYEKKIQIPKPYKENKYIYERLLTILKNISLNLEKLFLYDNSGTCLTQRALFSFLASGHLDDEYMKQILINIKFENYLQMLDFFKKNIETRMGKYIMKLYSIMPLLLNEYVFSHYQNVRELIKEAIIFLSENVSSANADVDIDILIIFCYDFFRIKDLSLKNKIYDFLIPIISEAAIKIMSNLLRILDLVYKKNYLDFNIFIISMKNFLDKEIYKKISLQYENFIENNEIESSNMEYYFLILNEEEQIKIFNYIYNNLLYIDNSNNIEINKHFLYDKFDKDYNIDITKCSIEIFIEKQLQGFLTIFSYMDFSKILTDEKMIKKFYELYYALMNQKDKKFKKLGNELFGFILISLLEANINEDENELKDENSIPLIEYPSEKNINIAIEMYEKLIIPYEKFVIEYMENNINNKEKNQNNNDKDNKDIDKQTLEQILGIYMKLIHKVSIAKCNLILNINFDEENTKEYKIIENQIKIYKKYKNLIYNSFKVINKIFDYNINDSDQKLFNNNLTSIYLDEILALKLKENSQRISSRTTWYKNINKMINENNSIYNFKNFYKINKSHLIYIKHFTFIKLLIPKDDFYYIFFKLYLLCFNSVSHPSSLINTCTWNFYSINKEKIKNLFNEIYVIFIEKLDNLKADSLTEQNIMKNISETYKEFCKFYISLFPYDSIEIIEKLLKLIILLKNKKYRRMDSFTSTIISQMKGKLQISTYIELKNDKRFSKFSKKNEIVEIEMNKINEIISQNTNKEKLLIEHSNKVKKYIDQFLNILFQSDMDINNKNININFNQAEIYFIIDLLIEYAKNALDKKEDLYRKIIQIIFNNILLNKVPVSMRILWIQKIITLMQDEYKYYLEYEWVIFKSKEEYLETWNKLKYEKCGRESMIPFPLERIRKNQFKFDEYLNNNLKYDFNIEQFLCSMAEIDEYEEDQKLVKTDKKKINSLDEVISKLVLKNFNEKKGIDFNKVKMFYYMLKLKYIDYNLDFVKNINFNSDFYKNEEKKIKQNSVIYEFMLGKYQYMFDNNLFKENDRKDLWDIMNRFTRRVDKIVDEKIYASFNYLFSNYALKDLEFIFNYDFYKFPIDFVGDIYFLYHQDLPNLRNDAKMFINSKTEELLTKIFSTSENIILDLNYLVYVIRMYYTTNGILNYNYYTFINEFTDKLDEHFIGIVEKCDTNYRRYALSTIYNFFFDYLNNNLEILKITLPKMGLCINEFNNSSDKTTMSDKSKKILTSLELSFRSFTGYIHFPSLCDVIVDILNKENDRNDTNKSLYLQVVNNIYKYQKHLNIFKYSSQELFDNLFKVFSAIKNEELKKNFSSIFLTYFNDLTEEENIKFIEKYEKYIYENNNEENEDKNKYNYIYILMNQLLRFKIRIPKYMQEFIVKLKSVNKSENDKLKKIIIDSLKKAMNYYHGSYIFMKENLTEECKEVLEEMTKDKTYFV